MTTVRVLPADFVFEVPAGVTVMDAAQQAGLIWPTVCGGEGTCLTCVLEIHDGVDRVVAMTDGEAEAIAVLPARLRAAGPALRLACQLEPFGDIVVRKPGVRARAVAA